MRAGPRQQSGDPEPAHVRKGVRAVALFEAGKGAVVLLAGFGLLSMIHGSARDVAEQIVAFVHLDPSGRYSRIFIDIADHLSDTRLWMLAGLALLYSSLRFLEAYGLWRERRWAEWLAVASGGIYLPFEIYQLCCGTSPLKLAILAINVIVIAYMAFVLKASKTPKPSSSV